MKYATIDTECTCLKLHPKNLNGNPFAEKNKMVYLGLMTDDGTYLDFSIEYQDRPYGDNLRRVQEIINEHDCIVGFNLKFDLHWLARYGISILGKRVFDTQLVEFILRSQSIPYPSLNDTALSYGLEGKLDVVKEEFWKKGIDTDEIPEDILHSYLQQDVEQTFAVFQKQMEIIPNSKRRLISIQNQDLQSLLEIEKNGMLYDVETSKTEGEKLQEELNEIDSRLIEITGFPYFNPSSGDHISAVLYGGSVYIPLQESYTFVYKSGRTAEKTRWVKKEFKFSPLAKAPKGSELKKEGFYATNADTLKNLKVSGKAIEVIALLLQRAELEKLRGTYLQGLPQLIESNGWEKGMIHGTLNQCVAITGRLSSSKPNLQNMDKSIGYLFKTRY